MEGTLTAGANLALLELTALPAQKRVSTAPPERLVTKMLLRARNAAGESTAAPGQRSLARAANRENSVMRRSRRTPAMIARRAKLFQAAAQSVASDALLGVIHPERGNLSASHVWPVHFRRLRGRYSANRAILEKSLHGHSLASVESKPTLHQSLSI